MLPIRLISRRFSTPCKPLKSAFPPTFDHRFVEDGWYNYWRDCGQFDQLLKGKDVDFAMVLPPPNVTGRLHLGHALTVAVQDSLVRWNRMQGRNVCWVPGFDHAGIATQTVVERWLLKEHGINLVDCSREQFLGHCQVWKQKRVEEISQQLCALGASLDWSQVYYTMDENFTRTVNDVFIELFERELIFRDNRLVNWCVALQSTISDNEVEMCRLTGRTSLKVPGYPQLVAFGLLYFVSYHLVDDSSPSCSTIEVATSRPETIFADVALAVHPEDPRANELTGRRVYNPLRPDVTMPIVVDSSVRRDFGTGILKITPAHSTVDYDIGKRHNLELQSECIDSKGCITNVVGGIYSGMPRFTAREHIVNYLRQIGRLAKVEEYDSALPLCSRSGDVLESLLKEQWFLKTQPLAQSLIRYFDCNLNYCVTPSYWLKKWQDHLLTLNDWCLSRQLFWGHRVPAFEIKFKGVDKTNWIAAKSDSDAMSRMRSSMRNWDVEWIRQDEDVLDTWFSSALIPTVVGKCMANGREGLFPLSLMETGHDILFLWVNSMAMLGLELTGKMPFKSVLFHGLIRDAEGRKMSKSLGNVIDPIDVVEGVSLSSLKNKLVDAIQLTSSEIERGKAELEAKFPNGFLPNGSDALRFTLLSRDITDQNIRFDVSVVHSNRTFMNKIWQTFKFAQSAWNVSNDSFRSSAALSELPLNSSVDQWILSRLVNLVSVCNQSFQSNQFHKLCDAFRLFWWNEFCDVYLEAVKLAVWGHDSQDRLFVVQHILYYVFEVCLRLIAPIMPFVSEQLYQGLPHSTSAPISVHTSHYPDATEAEFENLRNVQCEKEAVLIIEVVHLVRSFRTYFSIDNKVILQGYFEHFLSDSAFDGTNWNNAMLKLAKVECSLRKAANFDDSEDNLLPIVFGQNEKFYLRLPGFDRKKLMDSLQLKIDKCQRKLKRITADLRWCEGVRRKRVASCKAVSEFDRKVGSLNEQLMEAELSLSRLTALHNSLAPL